MTIQTERLALREFEPEDAERFSTYRSDPEIARFQSWDAPYSLEQAQRFIEELRGQEPGRPGEWHQIAVILRDTAELIGDCAFCVMAEDPQQAEIGFTLAHRFQGRGYATEAVAALLGHLFQDRRLHRVRAICDVDNRRSIALLERLRFRREGHFVSHVQFKGRWASEYWYGMLRDEWERA